MENVTRGVLKQWCPEQLNQRMAEDLTDYLNENILKQDMHSDIDTVERVEIIETLDLVSSMF